MRHTVHAMLGVFLVVLGCYQHAAAAEESRSRWWPFGGGDKSETATADSATSSAKSAPTTTAVPSPPVAKSAPAAKATLPPDPDIGPVKDRPWMVESPFAKVSWPELRMPEVPKPHLPRPKLWAEKTKADEDRNSWVQKSPAPESASPMQSVSNGAHRVASGTKRAWHKTIDAITPGDDSAPKAEAPPRIARKDTDPPLWKRMFGAEEEKPQGPRTVTEWMAQERVSP